MSLFWIADNVNTDQGSKEALILLKRGKKKRSNTFPIHTRICMFLAFYTKLYNLKKRNKTLDEKYWNFYFIFSIWRQQLTSRHTCAAEAILYYTIFPLSSPYYLSHIHTRFWNFSKLGYRFSCNWGGVRLYGFF